MNTENRKYPRREIALDVHIETGDGVKANCWLADISQTGARLVVAPSNKLPDQFTLVLSGEMRRRCAVVWRGAEELGVRFLPNPPQAATAPDSVLATAAVHRPRFVTIRCPRTGRDISTGIRIAGADELAKLSPVRRMTQCPHCKLAHGWLPSEAGISNASA
jgi:PilZ domain